jgi:hypothetical protein
VPYTTRLHLEHQTRPAWPSEEVSHDECERHLRKLTRTACGCMRYANTRSRPKAIIRTARGLSIETNAARLFLTMSADRPLQGSDFACHRCDDPLCANPDHLMVGTAGTNRRDHFQPGRRIRPRREARFFDYLLLEIAAAPPVQEDPTPRKPTPPLRIIPPPRPVMQVQPTAW